MVARRGDKGLFTGTPCVTCASVVELNGDIADWRYAVSSVELEILEVADNLGAEEVEVRKGDAIFGCE